MVTDSPSACSMLCIHHEPRRRYAETINASMCQSNNLLKWRTSCRFLRDMPLSSRNRSIRLVVRYSVSGSSCAARQHARRQFRKPRDK